MQYLVLPIANQVEDRLAMGCHRRYQLARILVVDQEAKEYRHHRRPLRHLKSISEGKG